MSDVLRLSRPVDIAAIGGDGLKKTIEASEAERRAIADALGLVAVDSLSADLTLTRDGKGVVDLDGRVRAEIVQSCVVSLDPVPQSIDEPIAMRFVAAQDAEPERAMGEVRIDPDEEDPPEVVVGPSIDLGPAVLEHFVLAIDPYPRAPGAALPDNPAEAPPDSRDSPFAALAGLGRSDPKNQ